MAFFSKLYIFFALSLAALAVQIPLRESDSEMGSYRPESEMTTCSVNTDLVDHRGRATWYEPGLGNCGWKNDRNQKVIAISKKLYDSNKGKNCGQWIEIVDNKNGKKSRGQTVDSCPGCGVDDLDLSPALFKDLDNLGVGVLSITWHFLPKTKLSTVDSEFLDS